VKEELREGVEKNIVGAGTAILMIIADLAGSGFAYRQKKV
jgi:hypothetical protein